MIIEWLQTNIVIVGAAAGGVLLVLLVAVIALAASKKPKKPAKTIGKPTKTIGDVAKRATPMAGATSPQPAPKSLPVSLVYQAGLATNFDWKSLSGDPIAVSGSGLLVLPGANAVSTLSAPAREGDDFICDYEARLVTPATNGGPVNFYVGAVLKDAAGRLVGYWVEQPAFAAGETTRKGTTYATAPKGSATVHIGVHGSWLPDSSNGNGEVEFTSLRVRSK